jgi:hypothetical protein
MKYPETNAAMLVKFSEVIRYSSPLPPKKIRSCFTLVYSDTGLKNWQPGKEGKGEISSPLGIFWGISFYK